MVFTKPLKRMDRGRYGKKEGNRKGRRRRRENLYEVKCESG